MGEEMSKANPQPGDYVHWNLGGKDHYARLTSRVYREVGYYRVNATALGREIVLDTEKNFNILSSSEVLEARLLGKF